jgi:hypothetical protein
MVAANGDGIPAVPMAGSQRLPECAQVCGPLREPLAPGYCLTTFTV